MVAPIIVSAGAVAGGALIGSIVGGAVGLASSTFVAPTLTPSQRNSAYTANRGNPNNIPSVDQLIGAYWLNQISLATLQDESRKLGVNITGDEPNPLNQPLVSVWNSIVAAAQPRIPLEVLMTAKSMGFMDQKTLNQQVDLHGFKVQGAFEAFRSRMFTPPYQLALQNYRQGTFTSQELESVKAKLGMYRQGDWYFYDRANDVIPPPTAIDLWRSERVSDDVFDHLIEANGYPDQTLKSYWFGLAQDSTLPPPTDLLRFMVKEAFTPDVARAERLYDEFPEAINQYAMRHGFGRRNVNVGLGNTPDALKNWIEVYWASHWQPLAPGQAYQIRQRVRPDNIEAWRQLGFTFNAPDADFVQRWLRIADYPPAVRDYLEAIAYRPMGRIEIRRSVQFGIMGEAEAVGRYQDLGMDKQTAQRSYDVTAEVARRERAVPVNAFIRKANTRAAQRAMDLYSVGALDRDGFQAILEPMGFTPRDVQQLADQVEYQWSYDTFKESLRAVRSSYLTGSISDSEVLVALTAMGIIPARATTYLTRWRLQRTLPRRTATLAKIEDWLARGYITAVDATNRLANLGYTQPEIALLVIESQRKGAELQAKALSASERSNESTARELIKVRKETLASAEKVQREIKRITPIAKLQKWLRQGIISEDQFRLRMREAGYPAQAIDYYVSEVQHESTNQSGNGATGGSVAPEA